MIQLIRARSPVEIFAARLLFLEYAESLGFSLCFQGFDEELKKLAVIYNPPIGELILARNETGGYIGCVGVKKFDEISCEMKRLYVKPFARQNRVGEQLVRESISAAKELGYRGMLLDTIRDRMQSAIKLYFIEGFVEIAPYYPNPIDGVLYMGKDLTAKV